MACWWPGQGAGRQLAAKLKAYLRPKCHAVLLDPAVNSPATVRLNLFQARAALRCPLRELSPAFCRCMPCFRGFPVLSYEMNIDTAVWKLPDADGVQLLLLAAMKLHCHCAMLDRGPRSDGRALLAAIHGGLAYLTSLVRARVLGARRR